MTVKTSIYNRGPRGGFTLVETLAAGMVLTLSVSVLGVSLGQSHHALQQAKDNQRAAELLDQLLTKVDAIGPASLSQAGVTEGQFDDRFSWQLEFRPRPEGHLFEVTATVRWADGRDMRSARAQTLLNDPPDARPPGLQWDDL